MNTTQANLPTIPLGREVHRLAEKFAAQQTILADRKRVYLNTLAVSAVHTYLQWLEIATNLEQSDSWNPVTRTLFDVADLILPDLGQTLECRPVLPGETALNFPLTATENLIGYVAVQFGEILSEVKILGFFPAAAVREHPTKQIQISELQSLDTLIDSIYEAKKAISVQETSRQTAVPLTQRLVNFMISLRRINAVEIFRQTLEDAVEIPAPSYATRDTQGIIPLVAEIDLGSQKLVLIIEITPKDEQKKRICLRLEPRDATELPPLQLLIRDESGKIFPYQVKLESPDCLQLQPFIGRIGKQFNIQIVSGDISITEQFIVS
jgi:hypothetical protein